MLSSDIQNILAVVDSLYVQADPDEITLNEFNKSVASYFGLKKFQGTQRLYIRTRLSHLINGEAQIGDYTELGLGFLTEVETEQLKQMSDMKQHTPEKNNTKSDKNTVDCTLRTPPTESNPNKKEGSNNTLDVIPKSNTRMIRSMRPRKRQRNMPDLTGHNSSEADHNSVASDNRSCPSTPIDKDASDKPSNHKHKHRRKSRKKRSWEKKTGSSEHFQVSPSTCSSAENPPVITIHGRNRHQTVNEMNSNSQKSECRMARKHDSMISQRTCLPDAIRSLLSPTMDTTTIYSSMVSGIPSNRYCTIGDMKKALKPHRIKIKNVTRKYNRKGGHLFHLFQETECQLIITIHLVNHEDIPSFHCVSWNGNTIEDHDFSCLVNESFDKQIAGSKKVLQKMFTNEEYKKVQITRVFKIICLP
jgi:hypothetical protein